MSRALDNLRVAIRQYFCRHSFRLADLRFTGIPVPPRPATESFYVMLTYFASLADHPSHRERVEWPCLKCGRVFRAHCGLDILNQ